jgi:hypothetical protein
VVVDREGMWQWLCRTSTVTAMNPWSIQWPGGGVADGTLKIDGLSDFACRL